MSEERARQAEGAEAGAWLCGHHRQMHPQLPLCLCSQKEPGLELGLEYWPLQVLPDVETTEGNEGLPFPLLNIVFSFPPLFIFAVVNKHINIYQLSNFKDSNSVALSTFTVYITIPLCICGTLLSSNKH